MDRRASYDHARRTARSSGPLEPVVYRKHGMITEAHRMRREGDEMACSCGLRWPIGEDHP